jgi:hypothetical protein
MCETDFVTYQSFCTAVISSPLFTGLYGQGYYLNCLRLDHNDNQTPEEERRVNSLNVININTYLSQRVNNVECS